MILFDHIVISLIRRMITFDHLTIPYDRVYDLIWSCLWSYLIMFMTPFKQNLIITGKKFRTEWKLGDNYMIKCNQNMIKWDHKNDQLGSWKWSNGIINMINWDHENDQMESWTWLNGIIIWLPYYNWYIFMMYV